MKIGSLIADWLFPPKCVLCRRVLKNGEIDLCSECRAEAPVFSQGNLKLQFLDSYAAVWYYEEKVRESLLRYKFGNRRSYAQNYGRLLAMKLLEIYPDGFDVLTYVPISRLRRLKRGYDQVELLANAVGRELGLEPKRLLKKNRNNPPQSGLGDYAHRRANVLGIYRAIDIESIKGKRILLLDDILTTGATAGEASRVLLAAGAKEVHCGVVAVARNHKK
jgi:ComF family protein